jgi:acyl-coenzyme A thioesterase PaaI-like protein
MADTVHEAGGAGETAAPAPRVPLRRGATPLPQTVALAPLLRRVAGLALALESEDPAVDELVDALRAAEKTLAERVPTNLAPRTGSEPPPDGRVYLDHSHDIGAYNPTFPEYDLTVDGDRAEGTVTFPLAFEGPPGVVHGGHLALFFDAVVQQHSCEIGAAGRTTFMMIEYLRPAPLLMPLRIEVDRLGVGRRSTSEARLYSDTDLLCTAKVGAVAGDPARLSPAQPRRDTP